MFVNKDSQIYISFLDFANVCVQFNLFLTCFVLAVTIQNAGPEHMSQPRE